MGEKKDPYNKGDRYEDVVVELMRKKGILPDGFQRAGAGTGADAIFVHDGKEHKLEIKNNLRDPDYGQRMLKWSEENGWQWSINDHLYRDDTSVGVIDFLNKKNLRPNKFLKPKEELTSEDKKNDQKAFEDRTITVGPEVLWELYAIKNVFYMQIGKGYGFYSLKDDPAGLGAPKFKTRFTLRLRGKTIRSKPVWNYHFYAVLKVLEDAKKSHYNLEEGDSQTLPPIRP